jgi:hypothetical protein
MRQSRIDYGRLVEGALRGVVRDVLTRVSREGLPSPHHFYVTFRSEYPGVVMPEFLRERYPTDMTIVLQHQFWGLEVGEDGFAVTLSFGGKHERLVVPYRSIVSFADPSVKFGLQFESTAHGEGEPLEDTATGRTMTPKDLNDLPRLIEDKAAGAKSTAQVVALDAFRKK